MTKTPEKLTAESQVSLRSAGSKLILNAFDDIENDKHVCLHAFNVLNELRLSNQLCDFKIKLDDDSEFVVHKAVLLASSEYFRLLFTNGMDDDKIKVAIHIEGVESSIMRCIIEWCYTRQTTISKENVEKLLPLADQYQIVGLLNACSEFLKSNLHTENVIGFRKYANVYFLSTLEEISRNYIMYNFMKLSKELIEISTENFTTIVSSNNQILKFEAANCFKLSRELVEISFESLREILSSHDLNVKSEKIVFQTVMRWIEWNKLKREKYILDLLKCVRICFLTKEYFFDSIKAHSLIAENDECKPYVNQALQLLFGFSSERKTSEKFILPPTVIQPRLPHEVIVVFGGWSDGASTNLIEMYDIRANKWIEINILDLHPRAYHGCVSVDNIIYIIGGFDGFDYFNTCVKINLMDKDWEEISPMHSKRCYISCVAMNNFIYAMGGSDGEFRLNTVERYNIKKNQWTTIAPMHLQRSDASAAVLDDKIYICGGFNGTDCLKSSEMYDPITNQWTLITPMRSSRSGVRVVSYNKYIYALGGFNGTDRLNTGEKYDLKTNKWSYIRDMASLKSNFTAEVLDDYIFTIGGFNTFNTISTVEYYNINENRWYIAENMNINRSALNSCVLTGLQTYKTIIGL